MSDLMLIGALRMPITPQSDELTLMQYIDRGRQAADLIEQQQQRIAELEHRNNELAATVERLRFIADTEYTDEDERIADMHGALESTPPQNLNAVKREAFIDGFMFSGEGFNGELYSDGWSKVVELFDTELQIKYPSGEDGE